MSEEPETRENLAPPDDDATASTLPGQPLGVLGAPVSISVAQQIVGERYRLEHVSGSGSMGRVFVAADTTLQQRAADLCCVSRRAEYRVRPAVPMFLAS